jgi:CP family cyanate transporter-like MFS transporter
MRGDHPRLIAVLSTLLVVGIALRTQVAGVAPLIPRMQQTFEMPFLIAGWLTSAPVAFLGVMAFLGPFVASIAGTRLAIGGSMVIVTVFSIWRALAGDAVALLLSTLLIGVGTGLAGALIPAAVRGLDRALHGQALGFFTLGLQAGTGAAAAIAVPLALWLGGWREALIALALPLVVALVFWTLVWGPPLGDQGRAAGTSVSPRTTIPLVTVFGLQAFVFHSTLTWLPTHLSEAGWSEASGGATFGLLNTFAMGGTLAVAIWCRTFRLRVLMTIWGSLILAAGLVLIGIDPGRSIVWAGVAGTAFGLLFPIAITLPLDYARDVHDALRLTAGTLGLGYLISSAGSSLSGGLRDLTGSFELVFVGLAGLSLVPILAAFAMRRRPPPPSDAAMAEASTPVFP